MQPTPAELDAALAADDTAAGRARPHHLLGRHPRRAVKQQAWDRVHVVDGDANATIDAILIGYSPRASPGAAGRSAARTSRLCLTSGAMASIRIALRLIARQVPSRDRRGAGLAGSQPGRPGTLRRQIVEAVHEAQVAERVRATRWVAPWQTP